MLTEEQKKMVYDFEREREYPEPRMQTAAPSSEDIVPFLPSCTDVVHYFVDASGTCVCGKAMRCDVTSPISNG